MLSPEVPSVSAQMSLSHPSAQGSSQLLLVLGETMQCCRSAQASLARLSSLFPLLNGSIVLHGHAFPVGLAFSLWGCSPLVACSGPLAKGLPRTLTDNTNYCWFLFGGQPRGVPGLLPVQCSGATPCGAGDQTEDSWAGVGTCRRSFCSMPTVPPAPSIILSLAHRPLALD